MTVPTYRSREDYTGNGVTTSYPYQFRIYEATDLVVTRATPSGVETTLVLNTDYTVTGVGKYAGGNVVLASVLASGHRLAIERALPVTQETDLRNQGAYFAETHEDVFDRAIMILQRIAGYLGLGPDGAIRTLLLGKTDIDGQGAYLARQNRIQDLGDPINDQDAANMRWTNQLVADSLSDGSGNPILQLLASMDPDGGAALVSLGDVRLDVALLSGDAAAHSAAYIDTFMGIHSIPAVPANIGSYQGTGGSDPQYQVTITAGGAGTNSVTVSETAIVAGMGSSIWPCVIEHDDGSLDFNVVRSISGDNTINLHFPLRRAGALLSPVWDSVNGQHMTKRGYRAYADYVFQQVAAYCTASQFTGNSCFAHQPPKYQQLWALNASLVSYGQLNVNNVVTRIDADTTNGNYTDASGRLCRSSYEPCGVVVGVHLTGHGINGSYDVMGKRGFIETHVFTTNGASTTPSNVGSAAINVYGTVNGVETLIYTKQFSDFLERIRVPYSGYDSIRLEVVAVANYAFFIHVKDTKCWVSQAPDAPLINKHSKIVTMGDSWLQFYATSDASVTTSNGAFSARLQELINAAGGRGTVINRSKGGMTTEWALAWFDTYVLPLKPQQVIFNFFTNDANTTSALPSFVGPDGSTMNNQVPNKERYKANLARLAAKCVAAGIQPIFLLPAGTASISQAQNQLQWLRTLRLGVQIDEPSQALSTELADATAFINTVGKRTAKAAAVGTTILYAQGPNPSDAWVNPQNNRLNLLEPQVYNVIPYDKNTAKIGTDSNSDGLSDGVTLQGYGTNTGSTFTPSISAGTQLLTSTFTQSASTGSNRLKFDFSGLTAGRDYMLIVELDQGTPNTPSDPIGTFYGSAVSLNASALPTPSPTTDANGDATIYWRLNAITNTAPYFSIQTLGSRASLPVTYVTGVRRVQIVDLNAMKAALGIDYASMSNADLFSVINASLTLVGPTSIRMTDAQTGVARLLKIVNGVATVS